MKKTNSNIDEKPVIALIAGPGGNAFNRSHIAKTDDILKKAGFDTVVIGDGEQPLSSGLIDASIKGYKNNRNVTVLFIAHGYKTEQGGHISWLGEKADSDTYSVLSGIAKVRAGRQTDFVLTSSYGSSVLAKAYRKFPKHSCITVLSPDNELITGDDFVRLTEKVYENLEQKKADFENLKSRKKTVHYAQAFGYCFMQEAKAPQVAFARKGLIDPAVYSKQTVAKGKGLFDKLFTRIATFGF